MNIKEIIDAEKRSWIEGYGVSDMLDRIEKAVMEHIAELDLRLGCCRDASTGKDLLIAALEAQVDSLQRDLISIYQSVGNDLAVYQLKKLRGEA